MIRRFAGGRVFTNYHDEAWHVSLFRIALIALMAGSFAAGPVVLRYALGLNWAGYLLPMAALYGAVGALTTGLLGRPSWRDRRDLGFRLGEVVIMLILARLAVWVFSEGLPGIATVRGWVLAPESFFSGEFLFATVTLLLSWSLAVAAAADFRDLAIQADEVAARESREWGDSKSQWRAGNPRSRIDILQGFAVRWIGLGAALVVCAGLTRVEVSASVAGVVRVGLRGLGLRAEVVFALVVYFLSGLILMSHGRLAVLRGRWYNQEVDIAPSLMSRWHTTSLLFIALVALVALLLPLGTTGWLTDALQWVLALIARIAMAVVFLLSLLIGLLARLLSGLLGESRPLPEDALPPTPEPLPSQAEVADMMPPWLSGAVLWIIVGVITISLLLNFAQTSGLLEGRLGEQLMRLRLWWRARQAHLAQSMSSRLKRIRAPFRRLRPPALRPGLTARGRSEPKFPREQVRRYYLAAVEEAAEEGAPRQASQTPSEFANDLAANWPESDQDIESLTEAFLDARYSAREIDEEDATAARGAWRRLAEAFRRPKPDSKGPR